MEDTPAEHYTQNKQVYDQIEQKLENTRRKFESTDKQTRRKILRTSHRFAVLSIQTPVNLHEEAFKQLEGLPTQQPDALQSVNYWKTKQKWINELDGKTEVLDAISAELLAGNTDTAHKILIDEVKGVGAVKAAFTLAMIGYTTKMCIDTNIQQVAGINEPYSGVVVEKYEQQCRTVKQEFNLLSEELSAFMTQWVLFDYQRGEISKHKPFFKAVNMK